ncbi:MAG: hypothetical protein IBJ16_10955 [Chitinophagaceae bacterium]|nr:hypothetical protein [Chitinophagaceae bacterium]
MKKLVIYILFLFIQSCAMDYACTSDIVNKSKKDVTIFIVYDRKKLDSIYNFKEENYLKHLQNLNEGSGLPFKFDTLTLTSQFTLTTNARLRVNFTAGGANIIPNYSLINKIEIKDNESIKTYDHSSLDTLFKRINNAVWEFQIN